MEPNEDIIRDRWIDIDRRTTLRGIFAAALGTVGVSGTTLADEDGEDEDDEEDEEEDDEEEEEEEEEEDDDEEEDDEDDEDCDVVVEDGDDLQDAIDDADPGDTICVGDGTYGPVRIDTEGLTLKANSSPVIDGSGQTIAVTIDASGVTVEGFEILGDAGTTTGIAIRTSQGATSDVTIEKNDIHGMSRPGGGGPGIWSWGVLSFGTQTLGGVTIEENAVHDIGNDTSATGIGIGLEEVTGDEPGDGAEVEENELYEIGDGANPNTGTGVAIQPLDGASSGAGRTGTVVEENEFGADVSLDIVLGKAAGSTVEGNE